MTRSQTYATIIITLAIAGLIALFFLSGGPEEVESLTNVDEPAPVAESGASESGASEPAASD